MDFQDISVTHWKQLRDQGMVVLVVEDGDFVVAAGAVHQLTVELAEECALLDSDGSCRQRVLVFLGRCWWRWIVLLLLCLRLLRMTEWRLAMNRSCLLRL